MSYQWDSDQQKPVQYPVHPDTHQRVRPTRPRRRWHPGRIAVVAVVQIIVAVILKNSAEASELGTTYVASPFVFDLAGLVLLAALIELLIAALMAVFHRQR